MVRTQRVFNFPVKAISEGMTEEQLGRGTIRGKMQAQGVDTPMECNELNNIFVNITEG